MGVGKGESISKMTREGVDEGGQEGVLGEVRFKVPREDASKVRKGAIPGAEKFNGEMAGNSRWVAKCVAKAVVKIQDVTFGPEGGDEGGSNVME